MNEALREARRLSQDAVIDLFELDLTPWGGEIYRWTPGLLSYRATGRVGADSVAADEVLLDAKLELNSALNYTLWIDRPDGTTDVGVVESWVVVGTGDEAVMQLGLTENLPALPVEGARWTMVARDSIYFDGNEYKPLPIHADGFEYNNQGRVPKPKLQISNASGLAGALVIAYRHCLEATVTRIRTYRKFLDGMPDADPTAFFPPDEFVIDRKSSHLPSQIEFELGPDFDVQGKTLPAGRTSRERCKRAYRRWDASTSAFLYTSGRQGDSCPFDGTQNGGLMYDASDTLTTDPAEDACSRGIKGCNYRFPNQPLPTRALPGLGLIR